jgi:hypothetical protein
MNPIFLAWLVQGQPRKRRKTGTKVRDYVTKSTITSAISQSQAQDGQGGI